MGRTYKEQKHGRGMIARMNVVGDGVTHVFVEHPWTPYEGKVLDDFEVAGGYFEAMRHIVTRYGCAWTRCDDRLFSY